MTTEYERLDRESRAKENRLLSAGDELHHEGWRKVLDEARSGGHAKYGIYGSRIQAVPHPEVYLQADALFWQLASTVRGFQEAYTIRDAADMYMMQWSRALFDRLPLSPPLTWDDVQRSSYSIVRSGSIYPERYPFYGFLDRRVAPLPVTLKTWGKRVTALEYAVHEYFRARSSGLAAGSVFIVAADDESACLVVDGQVRWRGGPPSSEGGHPILVFNEEAVCYPLMGRDDRSHSRPLREAMERLGLDPVEPTLTAEERGWVSAIREVARLDNDRQLDMARLAAIRAVGIEGDAYHQVWLRSIVPPVPRYSDECDRILGTIRECDRFANYLSPAAAYLAALVRTAPSIETGMQLFSGEYLKYIGVLRDDPRGAGGWKKPGRLEAWGHLWYCPMMEYTIDDAWRSGAGHCLSQSMSKSAALVLAGVDHYVTHFDRGGVDRRSHHFVSSSDGEWVLDDGILNYFKTGAWKTGDWECLLSFSTMEGQWASVVLGHFFGTLSPTETLAHLERIEKLVGGRFAFGYLSMAGGEEVQPKESLLAYLSGIQDWRPLILP